MDKEFSNDVILCFSYDSTVMLSYERELDYTILDIAYRHVIRSKRSRIETHLLFLHNLISNEITIKHMHCSLEGAVRQRALSLLISATS